MSLLEQHETIEGFQVSPQQERLWALAQQGDAGHLPYRVVGSFHLRGRVDLPVLRGALARVVEEDEILHTGFRLLPGVTTPVQVIGEPQAPPLELFDLQTLPAEERQRRLDELFDRFRTIALDREGGNPLRAGLVTLEEEDYRLLLALPALCADFATLDELGASLLRCCTGGAGAMEGHEERLQYADYAQWLVEALEAEETEEGRTFWSRKALDATPVPRLPFEVPSREGFRPEAVVRPLSPELTRAVEELAESRGTSPRAVVLAAWISLLWHLTRNEELRVGVHSDGRKYAELADVRGPLARYLPVDAPISGSTPWSGLLDRAAATLEEAGHYEECFAWQTARSTVSPPVLPFLFVWRDGDPGGEAGGLRLRPDRTWCIDDRFTLRLTLVRREGDGELEVAWDGTRLDADRVRWLADSVESVLGQVTAAPDTAVEDLQALGEEERRFLVPEPAEQTSPAVEVIQRWIEERASDRPETPAVRFAGRSLSYGELDRRANRLAHHLRDRGVREGDHVPVFVERGLDLPVAILGVLKAGAAYVPLDPRSPEGRLAMTLEDVSPPLVVTQEALVSRLPGETPRPLALDTEVEAVEARPDTVPRTAVGPHHPAYLIYTSGSTGRPKGVVVSHRNLVASTTARFAHYEQPVRRYLLASSVAFDSSVAGIFWTLCQGGELLLPPEELQLDPAAFAALVGEERPSHLLALPSLYGMVLKHLGGEAREALEVVMVAGEACPREVVERDRELRPGGRLYNEYGPTEGTVWCSVADLRTAVLEPRIPIGRPVPGARLHVLNARRRLMPTGCPGELCLGGPGVAAGYLGRPRETAVRFVPDPFAVEAGERLYRTGDLARLRSDGELEFLGRIDRQVKVRGFRVELGEVEVALADHPRIREAAMVAPADEGGNRRLVAYLVFEDLDAESLPTVGELREFLGEDLPEYMIPATFARLDELPRTATGKVDRNALPAPEDAGDLSRQEYVAPETPRQEALAAAWVQVLGVERVGIHDNFFELGGDSIRSVQVVARAQEAGLDFTVQDLFRHRTVAELAAALGPEGEEPGSAAPVEDVPALVPFALLGEADRRLVPDDAQDAYPLARLQTGMIYHLELDPERAVYHDVMSFQLRAPYDEVALRNALEILLERHEALRTSFHLERFSEPIQVVHSRVEPHLEVEDLRHLEDDEQERRVSDWLDRERVRGFDWTVAPLLRVHVHRRAGDRFQFALSHPHALLDGWSAASLLSELFTLYLGEVADRPAELDPAPPVHYRHFVELERQALESETTREFWTSSLAGAEPCRMEVAPPAEPGEESRLEVAVPPELGAGVRRIAQRAGVPVKSVLLALHLGVLSWITGRTEVISGLVSNGRLESDGGERLLGLFLNTLPLRRRVAGRWIDLVQDVFEAEREMMPHRRFPMQELQRQTGGGRLFDIAFNFVHFHVLKQVTEQASLEVLGRNRGFGESDMPLFATFSVGVEDGAIELGLHYDPNILGRSLVESIGTWYRHGLEQLVADPEARVDRFLPLGDEEREVLLGWGKGPLEVPPDDPLAGFRKQVRDQPRAIAVESRDRNWTFAELDRRTDRLAARLVERGLGPEEPVALCGDRTPEMLVGILACLKAGTPFVPLDPDQPEIRMAWLLKDSGARLVLTEDRFLGRLPGERPETHPLEVSDDGGEEAPRAVAVSPEAAAYVIYTSGSTGMPKGCVVDRRALADYLTFDSADVVRNRLPATTRPAFDACLKQLLTPLAQGAPVWFLDAEELETPRLLLAALAGRAGTVALNTVPSYWEVLLDALEELPTDEWPALDRLLLGGEALPRELLERTRQALPETRIWNQYGPTEVTGLCLAGPQHEGDGVHLGRPLGAARIHVLDEALRPRPVGLAGEIWVGGPPLARGYHGLPGRTAEAFWPDPFATETGGRLYRTGDRGRWRPDGRLEFLGRLDHQVQVRGFRVELGEVESHLASCSEVEQGVVTARGEGAGHQLVAYFVPAGADVTVEAVRRSLASRLPEYMVPSLFVPLETLPRTSGGKVDRRALPAPETEGVTAVDDHVAPSTPTEQILAEVWADVLGLERVSVEASFFELGGHSLLAVRLAAQIRRKLGRDLPLAELFRSRTVASLAARLGEGGVVARRPLVEIRSGRGAPLFLVHPVGGEVLGYAPLARALGEDGPPVHGLQVPEGEPARSVGEMADRYLDALSGLQPEGGLRLAGWSFGGLVAHEMACRVVKRGGAVDHLVLFDSYAPTFGGGRGRATDDLERLGAFARDLWGMAGGRFEVPPEAREGMALPELLDVLYRKAVDDGVLPPEMEREQLDRMFEISAANQRAASHHEPAHYPGRLLLVRAEDSSVESDDPALGWSDLVDEVRLVSFPGDHYSLLQPPRVDRLGRWLGERLAAGREGGEG